MILCTSNATDLSSQLLLLHGVVANLKYDIRVIVDVIELKVV